MYLHVFYCQPDSKFVVSELSDIADPEVYEGFLCDIYGTIYKWDDISPEEIAGELDEDRHQEIISVLYREMESGINYISQPVTMPRDMVVGPM